MHHLATLLSWQSLRLRLVIWYVALLGLLLFFFGGILYLRIDTGLHENLDDNLRNRADLLTAAITSGTPQTLPSTPDPILNRYQREQFLRLYDAAGNLTSDETAAIGPVPPLPNDVAAAQHGATTIVSTLAAGTHLRVLTRPLLAPASGVMQVGLSEEDLRETERSLFAAMATLAPVILLLAGGGGIFLAGRALSPVDRMTRAAQTIEATDLHRRLPEPAGRDEIGRLARTFNAMIARLEGAFARQQQFTADASHELRTPVTVIQSEIDVTLARPRTAEEYQETLISIQEEITHLNGLMADLLLLARSDEAMPLSTADTNLSSIITEVCTHLGPLAKARQQHLTVETASIQVHGVANDLTRLARNLIENALRYTQEGGIITVALERRGDTAMLTVSDTGPGIAPSALPHLFDRFYRADTSRNRAAGGTGLGLAIAQAIAHRHGGTISVTSTLGQGATFTVILPAAEGRPISPPLLASSTIAKE